MSWMRARTGCKCVSLFGPNEARSSGVCRWMHRLLSETATFRDNDATRNSKLAVKPRVPRPATVCLHCHLEVADGSLFRAGLQLQHGRIRVRANDVEAAA